MMKTILIVDDEKITREGISQLIDWQQYGFKVIGLAENGKVGLEMTRKLLPDLIITDIKMPEMTGLEMIEILRQENIKSEFIILSGYSDFEYAKKAIKTGVISYILKPIDEDELIESLKKYNEKFQHTNNNLKTLLINKLFGPDDTGLEQYSQINFCWVIEGDSNDIKQRLDNLQIEYIELEYLKKVLFVLLAKEMTDDFSSLFINIFTGDGSVISTGWQAAETSLNDVLPKLMDLNKQRYLFDNSLIWPEGIKRFRNSVDAKEGSIDDYIDEILNPPFTDKTNIKYSNRIKSLAFNKDEAINFILFDFHQIRTQIQQTLNIGLIDYHFEIKNELYETKELNEAVKILNIYMKKYQDQIAREFGSKSAIHQIIQYIDTNYADEMTLKSIAKQFGYNRSYLGKKIKEETKKSFNRYLEDKRMEQAIKLLTATNLPIYEISNQIGYKNEEYFYKIFKEHFFVSPTEYRKNRIQGGNQ